MAERKVKCQICESLDFKSNMTQEITKKYYHTKICHSEFMRREELRKHELNTWDRLYKYILSLHDLIILPKPNIIRLQAIRNGEDIKNGIKIKKYKMGATYELMLEAYKLAENDIKWNINNTLKGGNDVRAINYCISIMIGKLNEAWLRERNRLRQQHEQTLQAASSGIVENKKEVTYKKLKSQDDINDFL